jgi:chromosomal replication initiator protein
VCTGVPAPEADPDQQQAHAAWRVALPELELQMTRATFATWIKPLQPLSFRAGTLTLAAPNGYIRDWMERRLHAPVVRTVSGILGQDTQVSFVLSADSETETRHRA